MAQFTKQISFTGAAWSNLYTRMNALGFKGGAIVSSLGIFNGDAALLIYLLLTNDGINIPPSQTPASAFTDGWPIGAGTGGSGNTFFSDRGANMSSLDLSGTWIWAPTTVACIVMAAGA